MLQSSRWEIVPETERSSWFWTMGSCVTLSEEDFSFYNPSYLTWTRKITSLNLSFLFCKMRIITQRKLNHWMMIKMSNNPGALLNTEFSQNLQLKKFIANNITNKIQRWDQKQRKWASLAHISMHNFGGEGEKGNLGRKSLGLKIVRVTMCDLWISMDGSFLGLLGCSACSVGMSEGLRWQLDVNQVFTPATGSPSRHHSLIDARAGNWERRSFVFFQNRRFIDKWAWKRALLPSK